MTEMNSQVPASSASKWLRRGHYSLLSLTLALLAAEVFLRTVWPVGGCVLGLRGPYLHAPLANTSKVQFMQPSLASGGIVVRINGHGMLGPEPDGERERPRVMVFGDSFVMSENEPYEKTFTAQLAEAWQGRAEVLCAGVTGYGPDQVLLRMEEFLPKYKPDGVVLVLCGYNDLGDPVRNHLMGLDAQGGLVRTEASIRPEERAWFELNLAGSKDWGLQRLWSMHKELKGWQPATRANTASMVDYLRAHREDFVAHAQQGETAVISLMRDVYDADVALKPKWPSSQYKVRLAEAILREIRVLCEQASIPLVAVVVPGGPDMDPESWLKIDTKRYPEYRRENLSNALAGASQRAGIQTLNLFPVFDEVALQQDLYVGPVDPHWNANGMRLGAQACERFMNGLQVMPSLGD